MGTASGYSTSNLVRFAGLAYILIIGLGVTQSLFVTALLVDPGDPAATLANIAANGLAFRLGILGDTALYGLVLGVSVALFLVLRNVSRPIALAGLVLRSAEGILGLTLTLLGGLMPLILLDARPSVDAGVVEALTLSFLSLRSAGLDFVLILVGLGGAAFCYLFLKSRGVPAPLAVWGILTYLSMLALGTLRLLSSSFPASAANGLYAHGALFEVVFGGWLVVKGIDESRLRPPAADRS